jgi:hypothetical protein
VTRFLYFCCATLVLISLQSFADSITHISNVNVSLQFLPNDGTGGNAWGTLEGGGVSLSISGGTGGGAWFASTDGFAPGSHVNGGATIYLDDVSGSLGNKSYDFLGFSTADFNAGGLTFPKNGSDFTVSIRGSLGIFVVYGCNSQGCDQYNLATNPGTLTVSFSFSNADGLYYADSASFISTVPEPSTLGLLAIGAGVLPWRRARQRSLRLLRT